MYQQKQQQETKRKEGYVLSSPLLSSPILSYPLLSHTHVLHSHSMQQRVGVFSHCVLRNAWPHFRIMQCCRFTLLREFQESQKSKRVEIVSKILQEEQLTNRRQRKPALLLPKPSATEKFLSLRRASEKLPYYLDSVPPSAAEEKATIVRGNLRSEMPTMKWLLGGHFEQFIMNRSCVFVFVQQFRDFSDTSSSSSSSACSDVEDLEGTEDNEEKVNHQIPTDSLAEPEFSGLWDQHIKVD